MGGQKHSFILPAGYEVASGTWTAGIPRHYGQAEPFGILSFRSGRRRPGAGEVTLGRDDAGTVVPARLVQG